MILAREHAAAERLPKKKVGLALSGGGFRASIFHLGVIRRLEELGILQDIDIISAVSGGSIIAAYYICEMERHLRELPPEKQHDTAARVQIFEKIAGKFLSAVDHNLRTRALIFTPFYHPWLFIKTLLLKPFRAGARSELIQAEYDRWFYEGDTLDQLPSVTPDQAAVDTRVLYGPKLILNTTSLLTGERVGFSREPVSAMNEMSRVNKNVLPLSKIVGASSGVPVVFPPTTIAGNVLVDGGVADNQGIEGLIDDNKPCDILIISDASGQLEQKDTVSPSEVSVFARVNDILQAQVRTKLLDVLVAWTGLKPTRSFAFIHLFLNLKDRPTVTHRMSSEFIPALGRIRTDLDQFSFVEREALMYHGYTLIDAQLRMYVPELLPPSTKQPVLATPPLFTEGMLRSQKAREIIRRDLEAGSESVYLLRCLKKYPASIGPTLAIAVAISLSLFALMLWGPQTPIYMVKDRIGRGLFNLIPSLVLEPLDWILGQLHLYTVKEIFAGLSGIAALIIVFLVLSYIVLFPTYLAVRRRTARLDREVYFKLTQQEPTLHWESLEAAKAAAAAKQ